MSLTDNIDFNRKTRRTIELGKNRGKNGENWIC